MNRDAKLHAISYKVKFHESITSAIGSVGREMRRIRKSQYLTK